MKVASLLRNPLIHGCAAVALALHLAAAETPREHLSLDANWKFHLGDDWPRALDLAKAGASTGPAAEKFDDDSWRGLNLPHDWAVELPFEKSADRNHGFKPIGPGFATKNLGWYRRTLVLPQEDEGKRIWLTFDGVFRDATVWVNGWLVSRHESGYSPLRADITDIVRFGAKNIVTVRVDATEPEGWFYEGAGIYRHVWLDKTAPVAVAPDGIFVRSEFAGNVPVGIPEIKVEVTLLNSRAAAANATVSCVIIPSAGNSLPVFSGSAQLEADSTRMVSLKSAVPAPALWSPESPSLYTLVTTVSVDGKIVDQKETAFGIRTVAFDKDKGFLLNGRPYVLKGTCNHQDHAGVGVALPDALQSFRIARLKEMGSNAYRTSHNPPTPELLDACDRLGMIVMDENRLLGSDAENLRKWDDLVLRDRNHPSVCIWSVANEEFSVQSTVQGGNAARTMQDHVKRLDPTRPVTYAAPQGDTFDSVNGIIEVRGWNYHVGADMDSYHAKHPDQPNVGTEQASVLGTRGIYEDDAKRGYVRAYDNRGKDTAEAWWSYFADRAWLSGAFVWTGFDYRGEPTPYAWPCISSHFGILDTCGFPKDSFYYYKSWWGSDVVLHLLPHWNWPGREGQEIHVDALSNCREVELFLNGASLGRQTTKPNSKLLWKVKYAPGTLSAKGFDAAGKVVAETKVETTGQPVAVKLTRDLTGLSAAVKADGEDLAVFTVSVVDAQGREVPTAQNKIGFDLAGAGRIIGVGNGDPSCHEPDVFLSPEPRTIPVEGWRWEVESFPTNSDASSPVLNAGLDETGWNVAKPRTNATIGDLPLYEGKTAVYRAHIKLTEEELSAPAVRLLFNGCNKHGWYFVNGQLVGESNKWEERPSFDVKQHLHAGDNIIAVGVQHGGTYGGLNPNVNLEICAKPTAVKWSRSLFNGLAQIIVQSSKTPGEIKLTAEAHGLKPATAKAETVSAPLRPSVP
jgi:beta-galactosidase